jgi:hypothetical protein
MRRAMTKRPSALELATVYGDPEVAGSHPARATNVMSRDIVNRYLGTSFHGQTFGWGW